MRNVVPSFVPCGGTPHALWKGERILQNGGYLLMKRNAWFASGPGGALDGMIESLNNKVPAIQAVVASLVTDLGPNRVAVVRETMDDPATVTVALRSDPSRAIFIAIVGMEEGRYTVSYDKLRTKRSGEAAIEQVTSSGVVYEGLQWIARKIFDVGVVTNEFDRTPDKRRIRR
jgi:hypothetical protein